MGVKIKIKEIGERAGYTRRQLADILGINDSNLRNIENNYIKSIKLEHIEIMCRTFKITFDELFELTKN